MKCVYQRKYSIETQMCRHAEIGLQKPEIYNQELELHERSSQPTWNGCESWTSAAEMSF